jgi:hypothetical protein
MYFTFPRDETLLEDKEGIKSVDIWPLVDRVAFILSTGVSRCPQRFEGVFVHKR